ncbi:unnamed protein product [Protopolystoma xenopodis]|uniref:Uncharacterized protein n=1 Tax=Protopolystoma xenopodis TaxID=117903 RepID=A0A448X782_9PLAT|nr:unnamed protein product [Protopolystoma xenopodis]
MPHVTRQLRLLWDGRMVRLLFSELYEQDGLNATSQPTHPQGGVEVRTSTNTTLVQSQSAIEAGRLSKANPTRTSIISPVLGQADAMTAPSFKFYSGPSSLSLLVDN